MSLTDRYTPLMMAAEDGNLELVRKLLPNKNINRKNTVRFIKAGYSALAISVKNGFIEIS